MAKGLMNLPETQRLQRSFVNVGMMNEGRLELPPKTQAEKKPHTLEQ